MCRRHKHHPRPPKPPVPPTPTPPPVSVTVAWVNLDPTVRAVDLARWVDGLNEQVRDIRILWPHVQECHHVVGVGGGGGDGPTIPATIKPRLPEAPGALAYHDVDHNGVPFIVVGSQTCKQAGVPISSAMSHEAVELTVDPSCTLTATAPNGDVWALEVGDPVQASSYTVLPPSGGVEVSDFVGASFFGMGSGPLDHTGACTGPFTVAPGGYAIVNGQSVGEDRFGGPTASVPAVKFTNTQGVAAMPTVLAKYSKFIVAALTALGAVVAIVFGVDSVVALAVAAAVAPFAVLLAPANA